MIWKHNMISPAESSTAQPETRVTLNQLHAQFCKVQPSQVPSWISRTTPFYSNRKILNCRIFWVIHLPSLPPVRFVTSELINLKMSKLIQDDSFGTRPKKMRISQRLFIRFWTCIYDYIRCFMRSMSIHVCRSLTSWRHRDNDWRLAPCRAQPCHCVVR